jgi:SPP1 family predicted phage head-tail adaptor
VDIGRLDKRITLQKRTTTLDDFGQQAHVWSEVATVWASIHPIGGRERLRAFAVESTLTHTVAVRYRRDFMPPTEVDAWRIAYGDRIFNITAARDVEEAHRWIVFDCTEGSLDGE